MHRDIRPPNIAARITASTRYTTLLFAHVLNQTTSCCLLIQYIFSVPEADTVLLDFGSANFFAPSAETEQAVERISGRYFATVEAMYEQHPVTTSSDAVLLGADTLPADEASSLIYCALQEMFPKHKSLFGLNRTDAAAFVDTRSMFWEHFGSIEIPEVDNRIHAIKEGLMELHTNRLGLTHGQLSAIVEAVLPAVYRLAELDLPFRE